MQKDVFTTLKERGYVYQTTDEAAIERLLSADKPVTFYLGIDPTADSLHIGHFFALMVFRYLQDAGHKGILLIGGATALVGDPSMKSDMRRMMSKDQVNYNLEEVKTLAKRFIKTDGDNPALIVNNADWILPYGYVDFMRDVGIHFNVNTMLAAEAYANRIKEGGLTFLEMGYMLMQAYDFIYLNKTYGCALQIGGSDQWGNIVAGVTLNRKLNFAEGNEVTELFGLTNPLLLTKEGKKMGKSEQGTLWVAREKTTPYDFYQYFYNVADEDVEMLLRLFTRVELGEIEDMVKRDIIKAKRVMAYEITALVHGRDEADKVLDAVSSLFGGGASLENVPSVKADKKALKAGISVIDLFVASGLAPTKSEARRLIQQGGAFVGDKKVESVDEKVSQADADGTVMLRKGKKNFVRIVFE